MLVVTCRQNEGTVIIDANGKVVAINKVVSVEGGKVRIGTEANRDVTILRTTVYEKIYGKQPTLESVVDVESAADGCGDRLSHPATRMTPVDMDDAVGRHD